MNGRSANGPAFPVEEFVQSLSAQLDRAQDALALKAKTGRPLTFALKDLSVDLRVFWESSRDGSLLLRHAGPGEEGASTVRLSFTTITQAMLEENTVSLGLEEDHRGLSELKGEDSLDAEDRRKLERVGVRTVGQLQRLSSDADPRSVEAFLGIPVLRLRSALRRAARPAVTGNETVPGRGRKRKLLRIRGANLASEGVPEVRLSGEPVEVLETAKHELVVRPQEHHREGPIEVLVGSERALGFYHLDEDESQRNEATLATAGTEGKPAVPEGEPSPVGAESLEGERYAP